MLLRWNCMSQKFDSISVLDGLAEPIAVIDRGGVILYANREFERARGMDGSSLNQVLGDAWPAMQRVTAHATFLHGQASKSAVCFNYVCPLGGRYEITVRPVDDHCSSMVFRKLNDTAALPPPVQTVGEAHPHAALHAGMLADMGACLRAELSAAETFYKVALILGRLPDVSRATFGTVDNEAKTVTIHQDFFRDAPSMEGVYPVKDTEITSQELARGQIVVIEDVRTDYHCVDNPEMRFKRGYIACVAIPMHRNGVWAATLMVQSPVPRSWSPEEVELIRTAAERTWTAVENMRLLQEARQANAAKDRFLAMLSHELRTPLTPVVMTLNALQKSRELPAELQNDLAMIRRNIELETRLIDDLLDITRVANGKVTLDPRPVWVHQLLEHVCQNCKTDADAGGIELICRPGADRDLVLVDAARLQQVFWNLVKNAIKFTPRGGQVAITTSNGGADNRELLVSVTDTGTGIAADVLPRIFNAFEQGEQTVTRTYGGLGLGLAISKAIVDLHQGRIWAQSDGADRGSAFHVAIPVHTPVNTAAPQLPDFSTPISASQSNHQPTRQLHVLLVDDHTDTMKVMSRILSRWGLRLTCAGRISEALEAAANQKFDLLISDIGLPDGSGCELVEQLHKLQPIQAIALSGFGMDTDIHRSLASGFSAHLTKPVNLDQLQEVVARLTEPANSPRC
jgi:signal transduction histidine kinase/ActR/RegA family two-component response regulator